MDPVARLAPLVVRVVRAGDALRPLVAALLRVVVGVGFFVAGRGKWANFDATTSFFASLGLPLPAVNAAVVSTLEVVGGLLLVAGLGTRLLAGALAGTMVVALLTADRAAFSDALVGGTPASVLAFVYLALLAFCVAFGGGRWSLDRVVADRFARRSDAACAYLR